MWKECTATHRTGFKTLLVKVIKGQIVVLNWSFDSISLWWCGNWFPVCTRSKWLLKFPFPLASILMYINACTTVRSSTYVTEYTFQTLRGFFFLLILSCNLFFCCFVWLTTLLNSSIQKSSYTQYKGTKLHFCKHFKPNYCNLSWLVVNLI